MIKKAPWSSGGIALTDDSGRILSTSKYYEFYALPESSSAIDNQRIFDNKKNAHNYYRHRIYHNLVLHTMVPESMVLQESRSVGQLVVFISAITIMIAIPLLLYLFKTNFLYPIRRLNQALSKMRDSNDLIQVSVKNSDEISELGKSFNRMSIALHSSDQKIRNLAFNDSLTGLPNRFMFSKILRREMESGQQKQNQLALLFLDLDDFKNINDTLGHQTGDQLLIEASQRIQGSLRGYDSVNRVQISDFRFQMKKRDS
jgi:diguanylate cyclase